jgi:hypothetical protein
MNGSLLYELYEKIERLLKEVFGLLKKFNMSIYVLSLFKLIMLKFCY